MDQVPGNIMVSGRHSRAQEPLSLMTITNTSPTMNTLKANLENNMAIKIIKLSRKREFLLIHKSFSQAQLVHSQWCRFLVLRRRLLYVRRYENTLFPKSALCPCHCYF